MNDAKRLVKLNHLKIMTFVSGLLLPLSVFADDHTVFSRTDYKVASGTQK